MRKSIIVMLVIIVITLSITGVGILKGVMAFYGWPFEQLTVSEIDQQLEPYDKWFLPNDEFEKGKSYPGVILVPGCLGTRSFHKKWAKWLAEKGVGVLIPDSFKSRGMTHIDDLETVCEGQTLWGFERAGDILASLDRLREHPRIDRTNLHLIGWSHGGWSVMDAISFAHANKAPPFMKTLPPNPLDGVVSVTVLYPYCGFGTSTLKLGWPNEIDGLIMLAAKSENVDPEECRQLASETNLSIVEYEAGHWFDNPFDKELIEHNFEPELAQEVEQIILDRLFKKRLVSPHSQ